MDRSKKTTKVVKKTMPRPRSSLLTRSEAKSFLPPRVWGVIRDNLKDDTLRTCTALYHAMKDGGAFAHKEKLKNAQILGNKTYREILGGKVCFLIAGRGGTEPPHLKDDINPKYKYMSLPDLVGRELSYLLTKSIRDRSKRIYMAAEMRHVYEALVFKIYKIDEDPSKYRMEATDVLSLLNNAKAIDFLKKKGSYKDWCEVMKQYSSEAKEDAKENKEGEGETLISAMQEEEGGEEKQQVVDARKMPPHEEILSTPKNMSAADTGVNMPALRHSKVSGLF